MARKLTSTVHLRDEDGNTHVFGPDDELPSWAEKLITNEAAYATDDANADAGTDTTDDGTAAKKATASRRPRATRDTAVTDQAQQFDNK